MRLAKPKPSLASTLVALVLAAHARSGRAQDLEAAAASAREYLGCSLVDDPYCRIRLRYPRVWRGESLETDVPPPGVTPSATPPRFTVPDSYFSRDEVLTPYAVESSDDRSFAIVPYREIGHSRIWREKEGFLVGISDDDGQSWRFVDDVIAAFAGIDRVIPGFGDQSLPDFGMSPAAGQFPEISKYLKTVRGGFAIRDAGGDGYYELDFKVRKKSRQEIPLIIVYENPQDFERPYAVHSQLAPRQKTLRISSPLIRGFEDEHIYEVGVVGIDPETSEILFEHWQPMLFVDVPKWRGQVVPSLAPPGTPELKLTRAPIRPLPLPCIGSCETTNGDDRDSPSVELAD